MEQAADGLMKALGRGLHLAAEAIDLGPAGAGGVGTGVEQFGFEALAFALFQLQV